MVFVFLSKIKFAFLALSYGLVCHLVIGCVELSDVGCFDILNRRCYFHLTIELNKSSIMFKYIFWTS